jgi:peptide methionine sulfoxide reductase msrA/msrB
MSLKIKAAILAAAVIISLAGWKGLNAVVRAAPSPAVQHALGEKTMGAKIHKSDPEWRALLSQLQFKVMREHGTEPAFTGAYNNHYERGLYVCAGCGTPLFNSKTKYDHGTGWPSFFAALDDKNLEFRTDRSFLMTRTEVRCAVCGAHLGHVFEDGPAPTYEHYCINSAALGFAPAAEEADAGAKGPSTAAKNEKASPRTETATFAAGCFWGIEYKFSRLKGVLATQVGYSGGMTKDPSYEQVCTDRTGHAESVQVKYDPAVVSYEALVKFFFSIHDPTQVDRQGPDVGTQYRSVIFTHDQAQKESAQKVMDELKASGRFKRAIATGLVPAAEFFPAEEYHQKYYEKNKLGACVR